MEDLIGARERLDHALVVVVQRSHVRLVQKDEGRMSHRVHEADVDFGEDVGADAHGRPPGHLILARDRRDERGARVLEALEGIGFANVDGAVVQTRLGELGREGSTVRKLNDLAEEDDSFEVELLRADQVRRMGDEELRVPRREDAILDVGSLRPRNRSDCKGKGRNERHGPVRRTGKPCSPGIGVEKSSEEEEQSTSAWQMKATHTFTYRRRD